MKTYLPLSQVVNKLGKYLYKNIDSAEKMMFASNMCDIIFTAYYQLPPELQDNSKGDHYNDIHVMKLDLNITTYQNKIRINIIEISPEEVTIGYDLYADEVVNDLENAKKRILQKVEKRIQKFYRDRNFLVLF